MTSKSLDGIRKIHKPAARTKAPRLTYYIVPARQSIPSQNPGWLRLIGKREIFLCMMFLGFAAAFGLGMIAALETPKSAADVAGAQIFSPAADQVVLTDVKVSTTTPPNVDNDLLFNTPLKLLQDYQDYLVSKITPDILGQRKAKLQAYLAERKSPLASEAEVIAEQDHWRLILAISFAESTLGRRCYYNNCSGIGGSQIRTYKSLKNWILDFNRLLERRYKDKTLEQMCGVYVQPCNPNWLLATKQILTELKEKGIE